MFVFPCVYLAYGGMRQRPEDSNVFTVSFGKHKKMKINKISLTTFCDTEK